MDQREKDLHVIAADAMKVWIHQQILETAEPPQPESCDDPVQCIVSKAIDWRRDYSAMLTLALGYTTEKDYDSALNGLQKKCDKEESETRKHILDIATASSAAAFNDAVQDLLVADILQSQMIFLKKIKRVFSYLNGEMTSTDDFGHITPGKQDTFTRNLFSILKDQGTFETWKTLIQNLPQPRAGLYGRHINGLHIG